MKAPPASSLPKGKIEFDLFFGLNIAQRRGRTISVHFWCLDIAQRRGDLSHLYWVSTPEERPALGVLSVSKHFGTKVALWCPRPRRGLYNSIVSSMECLKHQGDLALIFLRLVPMPEKRPATATPYRPQGV